MIGQIKSKKFVTGTVTNFMGALLQESIVKFPLARLRYCVESTFKKG